MSQFSQRTLLSSQTSATLSPNRAKVDFAHYGFLVVDAWCAYGVHVDVLVKMRTRLVSDSGPFLESIKEYNSKDKKHLTYEDTMTASEKGFPRAGQRVLTTWPPNSLWTEFLLALGINDEGCTTAQEQVDCFVEKQGWKESDTALHGFMSCVQLWYYDFPPEKVCILYPFMCSLSFTSTLAHFFVLAVEGNHKAIVRTFVRSYLDQGYDGLCI
jgi:hypothetical protein